MVKDFHFLPLHLSIEPLAIFLIPEEEQSYVFSLKLSSTDIPGTISSVGSAWKKFHPQSVFRSSFLDDTLDRMYLRERRLRLISACFTILAVLIAGMGLFGMALFTAERQTKEIGIRKVLGASAAGVSFLLTKNFLRLVLLANLIALPIGWFLMHEWLQNFAYRTNIGPLVFAASVFITIVIALVTISYQTIRAATADPVESLRYE